MEGAKRAVEEINTAYLDAWKARAIQEIEIPGFVEGEKIKVKAQKPRLMAMAARGKIPNPLMAVATKLIRGEIKQKKVDMAESAKMIELYCHVCMVEPKYEEIRDIITDEQMLGIFTWAMSGADEIEPFRTNRKDGTNNNDGKGIPKKTK